MIQLAILACPIGSPQDCTVAYLTAPANMTPMQCLMRGMPHVARWGAGHPGYEVRKFRCVRAGHPAFPEQGTEI